MPHTRIFSLCCQRMIADIACMTSSNPPSTFLPCSQVCASSFLTRLVFPFPPLRYTTSDGNPRNKIVFIYWSPDSAKVKSKMVYDTTSTFSSFNVVVPIMIRLLFSDLTVRFMPHPRMSSRRNSSALPPRLVSFLHFAIPCVALVPSLSLPRPHFFRCKPLSARKLITPQCLNV